MGRQRGRKKFRKKDRKRLRGRIGMKMKMGMTRRSRNLPFPQSLFQMTSGKDEENHPQQVLDLAILHILGRFLEGSVDTVHLYSLKLSN